MMRALRQFVEQGDGTLPLPGSLPDMKALSSTYVQLQLLYRQKAAEDLVKFKQLLMAVLQSVSLPVDIISVEEIDSFAKNASYLKVIRGRRLTDFTESHGTAGGDVRECLFDHRGRAIINLHTFQSTERAYDDTFNVNVYPHHFALLASEKFYEMHKSRYPGTDIKMTEHITGGKTVMSAKQDEVIGNGEMTEIAREDSQEQTNTKRAKMCQQNGIMSDGNASEESDSTYEEDLNEMIKIAQDLLTAFYIKSPSGADQGILDACREM